MPREPSCRLWSGPPQTVPSVVRYSDGMLGHWWDAMYELLKFRRAAMCCMRAPRAGSNPAATASNCGWEKVPVVDARWLAPTHLERNPVNRMGRW